MKVNLADLVLNSANESPEEAVTDKTMTEETTTEMLPDDPPEEDEEAVEKGTVVCGVTCMQKTI